MTAPVPSTTTFRPDITLFAPIDLAKASKQSDGTLIVSAIVSTEAPDDQGEFVTYDALKKASADYMQWANVREMHQPSAVGTTIELTLDDTLRKASAELHIVDPIAVQKVETGVYKGVSIGGRKTGYGKLEKIGGRNVRPVTGIEWIEISLADRPSNPDTVLTLAKRSDVAEEVPVTDEIAAAAAAPAEAAPATEPAAGDAAATESAPAVAAAEAPAAAPEGADADPTAPGASTEPTAEPEKPLEQAAATGDLAKSAVDELMDANYAATTVATMIEAEGLEGDSADAEQLRGALKILQDYAAKKGTEVGTPEDVAERVEEIADEPVKVVIVDPFYYAAVTGDLAKRAVALAKASAVADPDPQLDTLISLAKSAGGRCDHDLTDTPASTSIDIAPETMQKFADAIFDRSSALLLQKVSDAIGPIARPDALDAMKGELLEALGPIKEELAKVAAQPASGGAHRFAPTERFGADGQFGPSTEAEVLAKAAQSATDPVAKEALGRLAATAQIRADQARS